MYALYSENRSRENYRSPRQLIFKNNLHLLQNEFLSKFLIFGLLALSLSFMHALWSGRQSHCPWTWL